MCGGGVLTVFGLLAGVTVLGESGLTGGWVVGECVSSRAVPLYVCVCVCVLHGCVQEGNCSYSFVLLAGCGFYGTLTELVWTEAGLKGCF